MMNDTTYSTDDILVRRVTLDDDFEQISELIYETHDYIYP